MKNLTTFTISFLFLLSIGLNAQNPLTEIEGTVKADELLLYDSTGDLRFRINADSGSFEMIADDTVWVSFTVDSPPELVFRGKTYSKRQFFGSSLYYEEFRNDLARVYEKIQNKDSTEFRHYDGSAILRYRHTIFKDGTTETGHFDENGALRYSKFVGGQNIIRENFNFSEGGARRVTNMEYVFVDTSSSKECVIGQDGIEINANLDTTKIAASKITTNTLSVDFIAPKTPGGQLTNLGDFHVEGQFSKLGGAFKIDHPQDPLNKYLYHSFVESPDMMNIYNGNVTTNDKGKVIVRLPDYFDMLNIDFRYQLTVIGTFAQAIVSKEIKDNQFEIMTDQPNVKVSWQVTGIRNDSYARENRIQVEVDKGPEKVGALLYDPDKN